MIVIEPQIWATGLHKVGILNLFYIPHFGRSQEINSCIKMLLSCVHRGYLWLDRPVSIDTDLIVYTLSVYRRKGRTPHCYFFDKKNEKTLSESMKEKFHTF
jgi:hypothetical protein